MKRLKKFKKRQNDTCLVLITHQATKTLDVKWRAIIASFSLFPLPLSSSMQLQEKFGWDGLKKVFAAYHQMSNFPKNNEGKMNLYAETFSKTVELNLTGFFKAWGWPIEKATEEKLSNLPLWSDHPMAQYA